MSITIGSSRISEQYQAFLKKPEAAVKSPAPTGLTDEGIGNIILCQSGQDVSLSSRTPVILTDPSHTWGKNVEYAVTTPNILSIHSTEEKYDEEWGDQMHVDLDQVRVSYIEDKKDAKYLVIRVRSANDVAENPGWGGVGFGVKLDGMPVNPEGYTVQFQNYLIKGPKIAKAGDEFKFPLESVGKEFALDLRIFTGYNLELEFWLE